MTKQFQVWRFILDNLKQEIPVVLLYVVESIGSSPGRQGFFMAVNSRGIMRGSIGGGIMEHKFVEMAKEKLQHSKENSAAGLRKQVHDKSATQDQSGMICSGEQSIFIYLLKQTDTITIEKIIDTLAANKTGTLTLTKDGVTFSDKSSSERSHFYHASEENWKYEELLGFQHHIHIIGGGHCGLALSGLMKTLDFHVHVYDERPMLNTMLQNDKAHTKTTVGSYAELSSIIPDNKEDYVVIMTFGYRTDDVALRALVNKKFRYLGLLGSKKKIEKMFTDYRAEGWSEEILASIHAPIGINIKSESPEEIAISIAAEIIRVKNCSTSE